MVTRSDLAKRFPEPRGRQADVLALKPNGHVVVLGTAGSGKTTLAMLRALKLSNPMSKNGGRTLLVTYNKALLALLRPAELPSDDWLEVRNYHHFARGYLSHRGAIERRGNIASGPVRDAYIETAVAAVGAVRPAVLRRGAAFASAEIEWISRHGIASPEAYQEVERTGRLAPLERGRAREGMWQVYQRYLALRAEDGFRFDWEDIAGGVRDALASDDSERRYRHIVIDEGQDFSPQMLRSLTEATQPGGSVTFFGDVAQQIYGRGLSWRRAGFSGVDKVWEFSRNYRNSPQIANLGLAIADMPHFASPADIVRPDEFADAGPPPTVRRFSDVTEELAWVTAQASALGRLGNTAVLFRRDRDARRFRRQCPEAAALDRWTTAWSEEPGIWVGTVHSAKGFEFQSVILPGLTAERWPEPEAIEAEGRDEALAADGRLLYVAVTRARQNLLLTAAGPLTDLMPANDGLWLESA